MAPSRKNFSSRAGFQIVGAASASTSDDRHQPFLNSASFHLPSLRETRTLPFASISLASCSLGQAIPNNSNWRKEATTGLDFPTEYCYRTNSHCPTLSGLGVRAKRILGLKNINVYAVGIYVDDSHARKALATKYKNRSADQLSSDPKFFEDVISDSSFDKTLRLVISFGSLKRQQFVEALEERLLPALQKAGETKVLDDFRKQFDSTQFSKGLEICFCQTGSQLAIKIGGEQKGRITSPALCQALFDVYLGSDPASREAKDTFARSMAAVLSK